MLGEAVIEFGALRVSERCRVCFQTFPHFIQQLCFFRGREGVDLVAQTAHIALTLARFPPWCKRRGLWVEQP